MSDATVHFISGDLVFASRVRAAAESAGVSFRLSMRPPDEAEGASTRWVILDLSTRSGQTADLMAACRIRCPEADVIAYGPHVQVDRLQKARQSGIPTVLTRGQFNSGLSNLLAAT
ncbi:MAG: histidine kinase [Planctomycetota bacterium]